MTSLHLEDPCSRSALCISTSAFAELVGVWAVTGVVTLNVIGLILLSFCIGYGPCLISSFLNFLFCILPLISFSYEKQGFLADFQKSDISSMGMSLFIFLVSGVWEATGVVAESEFGDPLTFLGTSSWNGISESFQNFVILDFVTFQDAERSLVYRAGVCGKAVGLAAYTLVRGPFSSPVTSISMFGMPLLSGDNT